MSGSLSIRNQQRAFSVNVDSLRRLTLNLIQDLFKMDDFDLTITLVRTRRMAQLNETILQHKGSTDVITLDYGTNDFHASPIATRKKAAKTGMRNDEQPSEVRGEIFICLDDAQNNAREFRTIWQSEVVRYVIHGILHLQGHNDLEPSDRRKMKREENRLLNQVSRRFTLKRIGKSH